MKTIKQMLEEIKWVEVTPRKFLSKMKDGEIITNLKLKKGTTNFYTLRISIGQDVLKKINLKSGDRVVIMADPNNKLNILLVKCETGGGRLISKIAGSKHGTLTFSVGELISPPKILKKIIDYQAYEKYLQFEVN